MNAYPKPRPGVLDIEAYVPGKSSAPGVAKVFKLSSNETPLGPSPRAVATYNAAGAHLEEYPHGSASELRDAIGRAFGLDPERIVCGAGSDDLLHLLAYAYLVDGDARLRVPRRSEPRTSVPAGSVALAGEFSAIYPRQSPGGWQLIGHTDAVLWDLARPDPALLTQGMWVQFRAG